MIPETNLRLLGGLLHVVLSIGLAHPASALAAPTSPDGAAADATATDADLNAPVRASLAVETSAVGPAGLVLVRRIEELGDIELRRAEVLPSHGERDPLLKISLRPLDEGGYAIVSALVIAGELVPNSEREVLCNLCTEGETVERARVEVDRLIPYVREHAAEEAQVKASSERRAQTEPDEPDEPSRGRDRPRLGVKGKAGVPLLGLGIVGVGVGAVLAARSPTVKPEMPLETLDTRTPGYVTLGVAGGALLSGAVLLLLDRRSSTSQIAIAPHGRGVTLFGRF